jgi:predicted metal-dependent HD superfamily phosphohydrolase
MTGYTHYLDEVRKYYDEPHRFYHTIYHIGHMLYDGVLSMDITTEQLYAILYHDAIYDPLASDNEEKSYELYASIKGENQIVKDIILSTKKHIPLCPEAELVLDLDMEVLSWSWNNYLKYTQQVRQEYSMVPDEMFYAGRLKFLEECLKRERLYYTDWGYSEFEDNARKNIQKEIDLINSMEG